MEAADGSRGSRICGNFAAEGTPSQVRVRKCMKGKELRTMEK